MLRDLLFCYFIISSLTYLVFSRGGTTGFSKECVSRCQGVCFSGFSRETTASILALTVCPLQTDENIVGQQLPTLLVVTCWVRLTALLHVVECCWELLPKVHEIVQTFSYVKTDATTPNDIVGRCYVCLQVVLDILLSKGSR